MRPPRHTRRKPRPHRPTTISTRPHRHVSTDNRQRTHRTSNAAGTATHDAPGPSAATSVNAPPQAPSLFTREQRTEQKTTFRGTLLRTHPNTGPLARPPTPNTSPAHAQPTPLTPRHSLSNRQPPQRPRAALPTPIPAQLASSSRARPQRRRGKAVGRRGTPPTAPTAPVHRTQCTAYGSRRPGNRRPPPHSHRPRVLPRCHRRISCGTALSPCAVALWQRTAALLKNMRGVLRGSLGACSPRPFAAPAMEGCPSRAVQRSAAGRRHLCRSAAGTGAGASAYRMRWTVGVARSTIGYCAGDSGGGDRGGSP